MFSKYIDSIDRLAELRRAAPFLVKEVVSDYATGSVYILGG